MQARENMRSVSYLISHAAQISDDVAANGAPYIIRQNGEAAMVIEGVQQYQDKGDLIALLKVLALGEKDRQAGLGLSVQESRAQLARVDAGLITGPVVSLLGNLGITDYRTVLTALHRVLYRQVSGNTYVYAVAGQVQDFQTLLLRRLFKR